MKYFAVLMCLALTACAVDPEGRADVPQALKDREGKPVREHDAAPYDPEPVDVDAGTVLPDAGQAAPDTGAELGRDGGAPPADSAAPAPDSAVAAVDAGTDARVDVGPPPTLAGAWRVVVGAQGASCMGAPSMLGEQRWQWDPGASTLATDNGTLSRLREGLYEGAAGAIVTWTSTLDVQLELEGFVGELVRKGPSCSDRWDVLGVRP